MDEETNKKRVLKHYGLEDCNIVDNNGDPYVSVPLLFNKNNTERKELKKLVRRMNINMTKNPTKASKDFQKLIQIVHKNKLS